MAITVFGIASCDSCRKARHWLDASGLVYRYHDLRREGVPEKALQAWVARAGWEKLLNRRSATWRRIPDVDKDIQEPAQAMALMLEYPTLIKRPVICSGRDLLVGFDAEEYGRELKGRTA